MKVRLGFVSNSSSSSFILYGDRVNNERDLKNLIGKTKKRLNKECLKFHKDSYVNYAKGFPDAFSYLLDKFKNKSDLIIKTDADFKKADEVYRKIYEVDFDAFEKMLDDKNSFIYKTIVENVEWSSHKIFLSYRDLSPIDVNAKRLELFKDRVGVYPADEIGWGDEYTKIIAAPLINKAVEVGIKRIKEDIKWFKNNWKKDEYAVYYITFSTEIGEREFDYFFRSGIPFEKALFIRDERS